MKENFVMKLVREPTKGGAPVDLMFTNRERLVENVKIRSCLEQSDHKMVEFPILGKVRSGGSKTAAFDFWRADIELSSTQVVRLPRDSVLKGKGVQEGWLLLKKEVLKAQEQAISLCCKMSWWGRRLVWMNKELFLKLQEKKRT